MASQPPTRAANPTAPTGAAGSTAERAAQQRRGGAVLRAVMVDSDIQRALKRIAHEVLERNPDPAQLYLVAVPNGGVPLGRRLAANLAELCGEEIRLGILDTTLYRDDLGSVAERPRLRRTEMPHSVDDRVVILVEDVVNTGRTIRAAMDALKDFGRPRAVQVVALVDRGDRELPIRIDFVGKNVATEDGESVRLRAADGGSELDGELQVAIEASPTVETSPGASRQAGAAAEGGAR